jgi:hypothetical protein
MAFFKDLGKSIANKTINPLKNLVKDKADYNIDLSVKGIEIVTSKKIMVEVRVRRGNKDVLVTTPFLCSPVSGGSQTVHVNQPTVAIPVTIFSKTVDGSIVPEPKEGEIYVSFTDSNNSNKQQAGFYKELNYCRHFGDYAEQRYELVRSEPIDPKVHVKRVIISAKLTPKENDTAELH